MASADMESIQTVLLIVTAPAGLIVNEQLDCGVNGAQTAAELLTVLDARYSFDNWGFVVASGHFPAIWVYSAALEDPRQHAQDQLDAAMAAWRTSGAGGFTVTIVASRGPAGPTATDDPALRATPGPFSTGRGGVELGGPPGAADQTQPTLARMRALCLSGWT